MEGITEAAAEEAVSIAFRRNPISELAGGTGHTGAATLAVSIAFRRNPISEPTNVAWDKIADIESQSPFGGIP